MELEIAENPVVTAHISWFGDKLDHGRLPDHLKSRVIEANGYFDIISWIPSMVKSPWGNRGLSSNSSIKSEATRVNPSDSNMLRTISANLRYGEIEIQLT